MNLSDHPIHKADPLLRQALESADHGNSLRVILSLGPVGVHAGKPPDRELEPSQFGSREAYRSAMIERRRAELERTQGGTLSALRGLDLTLIGGDLGRSVVAEGAADRILDALDLPGVKHAVLDQVVDLIGPRRPASYH